MTKAFAPAKVNLSLHVTGQRDDGYHLLDSLVVFVDAGDRLSFAPSDNLRLSVTGPRADGVPVSGDNLVLRAARLMSDTKGAAITLEKHLPAAAGIGGGSSDAAATLRGLAELWGQDVPPEVLSLGADVPVCLRAKPTRMEGIGERLADIPALPECWLVLVNPCVQVPTPAVFKRLTSKTNPPMGDIPEFSDTVDFAAWLATTRNDLQSPAIEVEPVIDRVISSIASQPGCLIARMSGSGATCWGLFGDEKTATEAAAALKNIQPDWWSVASKVTPLS